MTGNPGEKFCDDQGESRRSVTASHCPGTAGEILAEAKDMNSN